jgi:hypothetical protein
VRLAGADDVDGLTPSGRQVTASVPVGVNVHRLDGAVAVHLVNYDIDPQADGVRRTGELSVSVRLDGIATTAFRDAVLHVPAEPALPLDVDVEGDARRVTIPDLGVYGILELRGGM